MSITAEIMSIGTELLMGQIVDTNAQYVSMRLAELGVNQYFRTTVGDNSDRLFHAIEAALSRADLLIMTGGLGPTGDDLSKETAAAVMKRKLVLDQPSLDHIKSRFAAMGKPMTPNNEKQAMMPEGCRILFNPNGTAPGCIIEDAEAGKTVILLPGPPKEMQPMFDTAVMPYLAVRSGCILYSRVLHIFGSGESKVEYDIKDLIDSCTNPTIAPYAKTGEVTLRITARCKTEDEGEALVRPVIDEIRRRLGDVVYSTNDESMNTVVAELLKRRGLTVAAAESCTGGMLSSMFVEISGSSQYFLEGAVTYSNAAKRARLNVKAATLDAYGPVSEQTAREMAEGIRATSGADFGLATTGLAGPNGDGEDKPVGLVYIALAEAGNTEVRQLHISGSRTRIRYSACLNALDMLRRRLLRD